MTSLKPTFHESAALSGKFNLFKSFCLLDMKLGNLLIFFLNLACAKDAQTSTSFLENDSRGKMLHLKEFSEF